jgi:hypothetical protein
MKFPAIYGTLKDVPTLGLGLNRLFIIRARFAITDVLLG